MIRRLGSGLLGLAVAGSLASCGGRASPPVLSDQTITSKLCVAAGGRSSDSLMTEPTAFGLDLVHVTGSKSVRVLSVSLLHATGLRIAALSFVPGDAVGGGFRYGDLTGVTFPDVWPLRRSMPGATLDALTTTSFQGVKWSRTPQWQVVAGLLPTSPAGGTATGIRISYVVGTRHATLDGVVGIGLRPDPKVPC